jgi:hypothetical protein
VHHGDNPAFLRLLKAMSQLCCSALLPSRGFVAIFPAMTEPLTTVRPRAKLYTPKSASEWSRRRHERECRARYLSRINGEPTDLQLQIIEDMITLDWSAHRRRLAGDLHNMREAREDKRLRRLLRADFERSLARSAAKVPYRTIAEYHAAVVAERTQAK